MLMTDRDLMVRHLPFSYLPFWECSSTDSPMEVAKRFAGEFFFNSKHKVAPASFRVIEGGDGIGRVKARFQVVGHIHIFELVGKPPGIWGVKCVDTAAI